MDFKIGQGGKKMLDEAHFFYTVTIQRSIYFVSDESGRLTLKKIFEPNENGLPEGVIIERDTRVRNKNIVGITSEKGLVLFSPMQTGVCTEEVNYSRIFFHTSSIAALFCFAGCARACSKFDNLLPWDDRWLACTQEVLHLIGDTHPVFRISWPYLPSRILDHFDTPQARVA